MSLSAFFDRLEARIAKTLHDDGVSLVLRYCCPLDHGRHDLDLTAAHELGDIAVLPPELQHHIVLQLDLQSLMVLRRVSKSAMELIDASTAWKKVGWWQNTIKE